MCTPCTLPSGDFIETYQAEAGGCGDWPGSVWIWKTSLTTPSVANGWVRCNASKSAPGGAGEFTKPAAALLSGTGHESCTVVFVLSINAVTRGAPARAGSTGSGVRRRLPPDWRTIRPLEVKLFAPPWTQAPTQPSSLPTTIRPSLSI